MFIILLKMPHGIKVCYFQSLAVVHLHYLQKNSDVKILDVLSRTFNFRTLFSLTSDNFRTKISDNVLGKSKEQLTSTDCWPTVGRLSADSRPTVGRQLADGWPTVGRQLANCRPTGG